MRSTGPYTCPRCHVVAGVPGSCHRCGVEMLDAGGHPGPSNLLSGSQPDGLLGRPGKARWASFALTPAGIFAYLIYHMEIPALVLPAIVLMPAAAIGGIAAAGARNAWRARRHRARVLARRRLAEDVPVVPIAEATQREGWVRVRGRARVLRPAADDPTAAATLGPGRRSCGRFFVEDDGGAALVDDDFVELWAAGEPISLSVTEGDVVEVTGRGAARPVPEASGYRDGLVFVFDGTADSPLHLVKTGERVE